MSGHPQWRAAAVLGLFLAALAAAVWGWRLFAFLTDDAYIAFRTVHNHMAGHGWVWNPPPFRPVEGYTSFLWLVLLEAVWRLTGVEPPDSANVLSLGFGCATLLLAGWMVLRMRLPEPLERQRLAFLALDDSVNPGYDDLRHTMPIKGNGTPEQFKEVHETVMAT